MISPRSTTMTFVAANLLATRNLAKPPPFSPAMLSSPWHSKPLAPPRSTPPAASQCSRKSPAPPERSTAWLAAKSPTSKQKASASNQKCSNTFTARKPPLSSVRRSHPARCAPEQQRKMLPAFAGSANPSDFSFRSQTTSSTWKNPPPPSVKPPERTSPSKKPLTQPSTASNAPTKSPAISPQKLSPSLRRMASAPRASAKSPNTSSSAAPDAAQAP